MREDREFREFRDLMKRPDKFEDGFNSGTVLMALFVGFVMAPASVYMNMVAGLYMGQAAQWVTVLLYIEIARRAFKKMKRPEIFILFYMCGAAMFTGGQGWLWRQFLPMSEELNKLGIVEYLPSWFVPTDPDVLGQRNFFMAAWFGPIAIFALTQLITRLDHFGLGYILFRLTADVEELPFPMAPVGASGMTALAESSSGEEGWRYRVFAMGATAGILFGAVYIALPSITGAILSEPIRPIPLPFVDLTHYTEKGLPAMPMMMSFNLGLIITGMVMPFWAIMGSLAGVIFTMIANPTLYHFGVLSGWQPGLSAIETIRSNVFDFYFSFNLGLMFAVAVIGFLHMYKNFKDKKKEMDEMGVTQIQWNKLFNPPKGRGDFPLWIAALIYFTSTTFYIATTYYLVNYCSPLFGSKFPLWLLIVYGFVWTPFISYISARMEGIVGQQFQIPFVRESTFILSGYKGGAIWFAPIPMYNYAQQVLQFRTMELTGTKFTSIIKAEILIYPIMIVGTLMFAQFIWSMGPVPSEAYPYANEFWELSAYNQGLVWSATIPDEVLSPFKEAFNANYLGLGFSLALGLYAILSHFNLPVFLVYGLVRGLDQSLPHTIIPMIIGALLGRFLFRKWYGDRWPQYRIIFSAGFGAGMGLITMLALGFMFMTKSANLLPI